MPRHTTLNSEKNRTSRLSRSMSIAVVLAIASSGALASGEAATAAELPATTATSFVAGADTLDPIGSLVEQRLALADPVAQSKWLSGKAITDTAREQAVVDEAVALAKKDGVDPALVERVVRDQIAASKVVQRGLISGWKHNPASAPKTAPDLTAIRPQLDSIDTALVAAIGNASAVANDPRCAHAVNTERGRTYPGMDSLHRKAIKAAWASFCAN
ncbi:gamma subclass chorismate mutase AroQ [Agreia sp. COWG]|uniref:gamma subclass chorismate mutase AroQ n=1 Tax=Agreia sp. COWG TaxID=2773266 RepID=UPI00192886D0|nr:gamma subclass chorismate mutase AroQ [Agreia sp. COWG]CAD5997411.1 Periplasmic chorismate mutase I precursor [Agreia sp. COWG]